MDTDSIQIDEAAFLRAQGQGKRLLARGPLAIAARYVAGRIRVELDSGCAFEFPCAQAEGLAGASAAALRRMEITGAGLGLYWPELDVDLYVPSLARGVLGTRKWMASLGAAGGKAVTHAKSEAARSNGRRGGRPRKAASVAEG